MPYPNQHSCRIADPEKFKEFRTEKDKFAPGIHAIYGILENGDSELQAIRFAAKRFTIAEAQEWAKRHEFACIEFEPAQPDMNHDKSDGIETETLHGEEIFCAGDITDSAGNKHSWSVDDLKEMAANSNALELERHLLAPVKLGHNDEQHAAKDMFGDGAPALGWMSNLRVKNGKLIADFRNVPKAIAQLIRAGAWKFKSLEIWRNFKDESTGKVYRLVPTGVAILGANLPAVSNLNALMNLYAKEGAFFSRPDEDGINGVPNTFSITFQNPEGRGEHMDELQKKLAAAMEENAALKAKVGELEKKVGDMDAEMKKHAADKAEAKAKEDEYAKQIESLNKEKADLEGKVAEFAKAQSDAIAKDREAFLEKHSKRFPPSAKAAYMHWLEMAAKTPDAHKFSKGDGTEITGEAAVRAEIEAMPESDLFTKQGETDGGEAKRKAASDKKDFDSVVTAYCKAHEMDPKDGEARMAAYKALIKSGEVKEDDFLEEVSTNG